MRARSFFNLVIRPDATTFWDKPLAVLVGPLSIRAGELESLRASLHPHARLFGLPAAGGNTGSIFPTLSRPEWSASLATSNMFRVDGHAYLAHVGLQPDERVWLDQGDVANGDDTVVKAALAWIQSEIVSSENDPVPEHPFSVDVSAYPNPFESTLSVDLVLGESMDLSVEVLDVLGRNVTTLWSGRAPAGSMRLRWNGAAADGALVPSGMYFLRAGAGAFRATAVVKAK